MMICKCRRENGGLIEIKITNSEIRDTRGRARGYEMDSEEGRRRKLNEKRKRSNKQKKDVSRPPSQEY